MFRGLSRNSKNEILQSDSKTYFCPSFFNRMSENNLEQSFGEQLGKAEHFVNENRKSLLIIVGAAIALVSIYFAYTKLYLAPHEEEAAAQMFQAEYYFQSDSLDKAIKGDGNNPGFETIVEEYSGTDAANLAHYYLGMSLLKKGQFEEAIEHLESFDTDDVVLGPLAQGAIGDAYSELNDSEHAISNYKKAVKMNNNKFTAPMFLMKLASAYEQANETGKALEVYNKIKTDYSESMEARDIDKYIGRAEAKM